ncbi:hypothetical protein HMPREF9696_01213 [Afipia clevelandensis ATCC 49720]|uniref:Uncharacterized protein n=1 Tax=Afipia clevelandensis ATCC 49720 TaxID=883079 RepID=K8PDG0_9BRAD|nr:hypothetical protein HMPREF9696_01213 [Afipia clevelandensis ATCC 49720]
MTSLLARSLNNYAARNVPFVASHCFQLIGSGLIFSPTLSSGQL